MFALGFGIIVPFGLAFDSVYFAEHYFDGRWIVNIIGIVTFFSLLKSVDLRLRKLMIIMVPLGWVGEIIFCPILGLYDYRLGHIPLYVPLGHSIVYASGYLIHHSHWAKANNEIMKKIFLVFFISIFLIAGLVFNDILTLIFGFMFFYFGLRRKKWNTLYYYIACFALICEFTGPYLGNWVYTDYFLGFIPTNTPPVGVVYLYLGGDTAILRIMRYMDKKDILTPLDGIRPDHKW